MTWELLLLSLGLVLIIEGIMPFVHPQWFRSRANQVGRLSDTQLRTVGGVCMLAGLTLMLLL